MNFGKIKNCLCDLNQRVEELETPGKYAPLVDGKVPDANLPPYAPLVGGKVPDANLPDDLVRQDDLIGLRGNAAPMGMISLPRVTGSTFPGAVTHFNTLNGAALGTLPFTVIFPRIALSQDYLSAPPSGAFHLARFAQSASTWAHTWSLIGYPLSLPPGNLQIRHYGPNATGPGFAYLRVGTVATLAQLAAAPFNLVIVNSKTSAPKFWHNGVALATTEDSLGSTLPANGWATTIAEGVALLGVDSDIAIPFSGSLAPPLVVLGALSDSEAATYGRSGVLPGWAQHGTHTTPISSGVLLCGRKYRIVSNSGDGDFTSAGAPNNNVGTEFIVQVPAGVTPTWGTATVVQLGTLMSLQAAPRGALVLPDVSGGGRSMQLINGAASHNGERRGQFHARLWWNNTHEAKSVYGSAAHWANGRVRIDSIALVASGNVTVDVGDGSTANYYADDVALTAGAPVDVTLLQKFPTGLQVTVDPAANYTGTIDLTVDYSLL